VRLYVAVDDAPPVGVGEPGADLLADPGEVRGRQRSARVYKRLQVPAGEVFHDDVGDLPPVQKVLPRVVDLHDAGVREPRRGAALATEAHPDVRIAVQGLQDLHGHGPVQDLVAAEIDPRHAAPTDLALQNEPVC